MAKLYLWGHDSDAGLSTSRVYSAVKTSTSLAGSGTAPERMELTTGSGDFGNLAYTTVASTARQTLCLRKWATQALAAQTIDAATWTVGIAASESNGAANAYANVTIAVYRPSTDAIVGYIVDDAATTQRGSEWATSGQGRVFTVSGSAVTTQAGDVLVFEWWSTAQQSMSSSYTLNVWFNGSTDPTDGTAITTAAASYIEHPSWTPAYYVPVLEQDGYRWYEDDGTEQTATTVRSVPYDSNDSVGFVLDSVNAVAQSFLAPAHDVRVTRAQLSLQQWGAGTPSGDLTVEIHTTLTDPWSTPLGSASVSAAVLSAVPATVDFVFETPVALSAITTAYLVVRPAPSSDWSFLVHSRNTDVMGGYSTFFWAESTGWSSGSANDLVFEVEMVAGSMPRADANTATAITPGTAIQLHTLIQNTGQEETTGFRLEYRRALYTVASQLTQTGTFALQGGDFNATDAYRLQEFSFDEPFVPDSLDIWVAKVGNPTDDIYVEIVDKRQSGALLWSFVAIAASSITTTLTKYTLSAGVDPSEISGGVAYLRPVRGDSILDTNNYYLVGYAINNPYRGGALWHSGADAVEYPDEDLTFELRARETVWATLPAQGTSGVPVRYANSPHLTDQASTTARLTGTGTFVAGRVYESSHSATTAVAANGYSNLVAAVELVSGDVSEKASYDFRWVRSSGTVLESYSEYPALRPALALVKTWSEIIRAGSRYGDVYGLQSLSTTFSARRLIALYDARVNVSIDSSNKVTAWADARGGTGYGPTLTPIASGSEPLWLPTAGAVLMHAASGGTAHGLSSSDTFDLGATPYVLWAVVGPLSGGTASYSVCRVTTGTGSDALMIVYQPAGTNMLTQSWTGGTMRADAVTPTGAWTDQVGLVLARNATGSENGRISASNGTPVEDVAAVSVTFPAGSYRLNLGFRTAGTSVGQYALLAVGVLAGDWPTSTEELALLTWARAHHQSRVAGTGNLFDSGTRPTLPVLSDVTTLVTALGGDSSVHCVFDARAGIQAKVNGTTPYQSEVVDWYDARDPLGLSGRPWLQSSTARPTIYAGAASDIDRGSNGLAVEQRMGATVASYMTTTLPIGVTMEGVLTVVLVADMAADDFAGDYGQCLLLNGESGAQMALQVETSNILSPTPGKVWAWAFHNSTSAQVGVGLTVGTARPSAQRIIYATWDGSTGTVTTGAVNGSDSTTSALGAVSGEVDPATFTLGGGVEYSRVRAAFVLDGAMTTGRKQTILDWAATHHGAVEQIGTPLTLTSPETAPTREWLTALVSDVVAGLVQLANDTVQAIENLSGVSGMVHICRHLLAIVGRARGIP